MTDKQKAIIRYHESGIEKEEQSPLERLRFFCQLAMSGDDWVDAGHFFDSLALQVREKVDVGPWSAGETSDGRAYLESNDFVHDVRLYVDGDFSWPGDKLNYAKGIARQLNSAPVSAEPVAFSYDLATTRSGDGEYTHWSPRLSYSMPNVPDGSIRNLQWLYAAPVAAQAQPDLIRFDYVNADGQPDSKMITHDEMRERYAVCVRHAYAPRAQQPVSGADGITTQWWLAALDKYGNPTLTDGAHSDRDGADRAAYLIEAMGLSPGARYAVAKVELTAPRPSGRGVNHDAIAQINRAALAQQDAETGKSVLVGNQLVTQQNGHPCDDACHEWRQERTPCPNGQCKVRNDADAIKYWGGKETWVRYLTDHTGLIQITARDEATCNAALDAVKNALAPGAEQQDALQAEVLDMVRMLETNEWADHCGKSELGQRLEWAITALQNRIAKLTKSSSQQDADKVDADRYRWLRERSNHAAPVQVARYFGPCYRSGTRIYGADIDAAIDAASKEPGQ